MSQHIDNKLFSSAVYALIEESFEKVNGIYLDQGTSLTETIATLSSDDASRQAAENGTTIAAHVHHVCFYMRVLNDHMQGKLQEKVDWNQSWVVSKVNEREWKALGDRLQDDFKNLKGYMGNVSDWNDEHRLGGALAIIAHTAYHLGAIRQILKIIET